jgi:hypothetical protein
LVGPALAAIQTRPKFPFFLPPLNFPSIPFFLHLPTTRGEMSCPSVSRRHISSPARRQRTPPGRQCLPRRDATWLPSLRSRSTPQSSLHLLPRAPAAPQGHKTQRRRCTTTSPDASRPACFPIQNTSCPLIWLMDRIRLSCCYTRFIYLLRDSIDFIYHVP